MTGGPLKPIQVIPTGFTGLLQLKQEGRLPDMLSDVVAPVIEMRDWYLTSRRVGEIALFGAVPTRVSAAAGFLNQVAGGVAATVPNNQIWYVEQLSITALTAAAADVCRFACAIAATNSNNQVIVGPDSIDVVTARNRLIQARADRGFWAFPGDIFGMFIEDVSSAGITYSMALRATPCPL